MDSRVILDVDYHNQPEIVLEVHRNDKDIRDKSLNKLIDELEYGKYEERHILINKEFFNHLDGCCDAEKNIKYRGSYTFIPLSRKYDDLSNMFFNNVKKHINGIDFRKPLEDEINENPPCVDCGSDPIKGKESILSFINNSSLTYKHSGDLTVANDVIIGGRSMKDTFDKIDSLNEKLTSSVIEDEKYEDDNHFVPYRMWDNNGLNDLKERTYKNINVLESVYKLHSQEFDIRIASLFRDSIDNLKEFIDKV